MRKDAGELPNEEMPRTKPKSFPSARVSVPMDLGYVTLLACMCIHQPKKLSKPQTFEIFMVASSHRHD